jgi:hypothetical protein
MAVKHQIGAGGRIYIAAAADPTAVSRIANLNKKDFVKSITINESISNDNVTTMSADEDGFAERFIQALSNANGTMDALYGAPTGEFLLFIKAIKEGNLHTLGRGKTNLIYDPFGSVAGYLSFSWTMLFTQIPLTGELGRAVGGQLGFQVDGPIAVGTVPA